MKDESKEKPSNGPDPFFFKLLTELPLRDLNLTQCKIGEQVF